MNGCIGLDLQDTARSCPWQALGAKDTSFIERSRPAPKRSPPSHRQVDRGQCSFSLWMWWGLARSQRLSSMQSTKCSSIGNERGMLLMANGNEHRRTHYGRHGTRPSPSAHASRPEYIGQSL